jgi:hypothetical protein
MATAYYLVRRLDDGSLVVLKTRSRFSLTEALPYPSRHGALWWRSSIFTLN